MSLKRDRLLFVTAFIATLAMVGCGGGTPTGPSSGAVKLQGVVVGASGLTSQSADVTKQSTNAGITVTVKEDPSISVKVSGNGTFELDNVPAGGFTLVFSAKGVVVGTIEVSVVAGSTEISIVVQITSGSVVLVHIEFNGGQNDTNGDNSGAKTCMIEGGNIGQGIELEGHVASGNGNAFKLQVNGNRSSGLVDVNASGASYKCNGNPKTTGDCKATLAAGDQVHVRGTLTSCTTSAASLTATEVMVQK